MSKAAENAAAVAVEAALEALGHQDGVTVVVGVSAPDGSWYVKHIGIPVVVVTLAAVAEQVAVEEFRKLP